MDENRAFNAWLPKEDAFIRENYGVLLAETMALSLGRTVKAIAVRASRLGVRRNRWGYTCDEISRELGRSRATVQRLLNTGILQGKRRPSYEGVGGEGNIWQITDSQFIRFLRSHFLLYDPARVGAKWQRVIPYDEIEKWIPLSAAARQFSFTPQWFYEMIWRGYIRAQKGWAPHATWQTYLLLRDVERITSGFVNGRRPHFFAKNRPINSAKGGYRKARPRGWIVPRASK